MTETLPQISSLEDIRTKLLFNTTLEPAKKTALIAECTAIAESDTEIADKKKALQTKLDAILGFKEVSQLNQALELLNDEDFIGKLVDGKSQVESLKLGAEIHKVSTEVNSSLDDYNEVINKIKNLIDELPKSAEERKNSLKEALEEGNFDLIADRIIALEDMVASLLAGTAQVPTSQEVSPGQADDAAVSLREDDAETKKYLEEDVKKSEVITKQAEGYKGDFLKKTIVTREVDKNLREPFGFNSNQILKFAGLKIEDFKNLSTPQKQAAVTLLIIGREMGLLPPLKDEVVQVFKDNDTLDELTDMAIELKDTEREKSRFLSTQWPVQVFMLIHMDTLQKSDLLMTAEEASKEPAGEKKNQDEAVEPAENTPDAGDQQPKVAKEADTANPLKDLINMTKQEVATLSDEEFKKLFETFTEKDMEAWSILLITGKLSSLNPESDEAKQVVKFATMVNKKDLRSTGAQVNYPKADLVGMVNSIT